MSENQTVEAPVEQRYEYQPVDETGRPIGGKQVIKYTTNEELVTKLQIQLGRLTTIHKNRTKGQHSIMLTKWTEEE